MLAFYMRVACGAKSVTVSSLRSAAWRPDWHGTIVIRSLISWNLLHYQMVAVDQTAGGKGRGKGSAAGSQRDRRAICNPIREHRPRPREWGRSLPIMVGSR